jgi:uncharacterized protein YbbC (DUF1343 family)/CubicO group peptidase (beta-lactamase class C family)
VKRQPRICTLPMRNPIVAAVLFICFLTVSAGLSPVPPHQDEPSLEQRLAPLADIVAKAIRSNKTPGAVVLIGHEGTVVYRRAFGYRSLAPTKIPMTEDTVFDLASLTKPVATATAVMQLAEQGLVNIDDPVYRYWPAFKAHGKKTITVRQLLTHYSGLKPDLSMRPAWTGYKTAMRKIISERPVLPPGSGYIYSDINFEALGELVVRVSGVPLDEYCKRNIFTPLGMKDTGFHPLPGLQGRIAPTGSVNGEMLCGKPNDPSCYRMGGVSGHAGLFSTADDLALFAQTFLNRGELHNVSILKPETVEQMTSPQSPPGKTQRGLGWDLEPSFLSTNSQAAQAAAYGHLGYTGTALWIDPLTKTYVIVLTNRGYPDGRGDVKALRADIEELVSKALGPLPPERITTGAPPFGGSAEKLKKYAGERGVLTGIDVLEEQGFSALSGRRVGLITNHTGIDSRGRSTIDLLYGAPGVKLTVIFSPEHGLFGREDSKVAPITEPVTGLPVYSLYGDSTCPTDPMLDGLDALVFDVQDAGTRFYTYISTMGYAMEAAAKKGMAFYVLDRPDPINASVVQGPVMDPDLKSFTGYFPLPIRHGMTVGELAGMFNVEGGIGAQLHVIPMQGYSRSLWYDETGLPWASPSPNLRSLTEETLYPGVALIEGANMSVGRGTDTPFEVVGAPWIHGGKLSHYLNGRGIAGVTFAPVTFTPRADQYEGQVCSGVRITLLDRQSLDAASLGIGLVEALYRLYPNLFRIDQTLALVGSRDVIDAIKSGRDPSSGVPLWQPSLERFLALRSKYLLY